MRKSIKLFALVAAFGMMTVSVSAKDYVDGDTWSAEFNGSQLTDNFNADTTHSVMDSMFSGMQPGDSAEVTVNLKNTSKNPADFYMKNEVLNSFEKSSETSGGAYSYDLTYVPAAGATRSIYSSDTVGGEDKTDPALAGMKEATDALADYIFLESVPAGKSAKLVLKVTMDGESQMNNYEDTQANLYIKFAVEVPPTNTPKPDEKVIYEKNDRVIYLPNTGDDSNLPLYGGIFGVSLLLVLYAVYRLRKTSKEG